MTGLLHAHSGLRFLVLLFAILNIAVCAIGLARKQPFSRFARIAGSMFIGSMHLQVLLGISMIAMGVWYPRLMGHLVLMVLATALAQVSLIRNRKSASPGYLLPLIGIGGALLLMIAGIYAIGRSPLAMGG
jgi:heme A synthase